MSKVRDSDTVETVEMSDSEVCYTVFEGSSQEDATYAKVFWSPLCLQPPIESSLVSVDIRQRLKVAKAPQPRAIYNARKQPPWAKDDEILQKACQLQMQDEKQRYLEMIKCKVGHRGEANNSKLALKDQDLPFLNNHVVPGSHASFKTYEHAQAKKRDEIMALLKKQREYRIKKQMISRVHKPSKPDGTERLRCKTTIKVLDQDIKEVQELV